MTIVITGGTRGIGKAIALALAKAKHNLVLTYVNDDKNALQTKEELEKYTNVLVLKSDVSKEEEVIKLRDNTISKFGSIGASIATVITEASVFFIQYFMVRKTFDFSGIITKGFKYFSVALVMGIIIFLVGHFMGANIITNLVQLLVGVIVYIGILYFTKDDLLLFLLEKVKDVLHLKKA